MPKLKIKQLFLLSTLFYSSFYSFIFLKKYFNNKELTLNNIFLILFLLFILLTLTGLYIWGLKTIRTVSSKTIITSAIFFNFLLLPLLPLTSTDLYTYIYRSRIISQHQENPYIVSYDSFPEDAFFQRINNSWSHNTNIYGPVFTLTGAAITFLAKNSLVASIYLFKIFFLSLNILSIFLIKKITQSKQAVYLYAWNPFIIFEIAINAHNEIFQITLMLIAIMFFYRKSSLANFTKGWFFLSLSILIKYFSILMLPLYAIFSLHKLQLKNKLIFLSTSLIILIALTTILFYPFWEGTIIFSRVSALSQKISLFSSPTLLFLAALLSYIGITAPYVLSKTINRFTFTLSYFIILLKLLFKKNFYNYYKKSDFIFFTMLIYGFFFLTFFTWLMPWYLITLITLFIIQYSFSKNEKYFHLSTVTTVFAILFYLLLR